MTHSLWQPTATMQALRERAAIMQKIRCFFAERDVLEVETPCLSGHTITDPYIEAMQTVHTLMGVAHSRTLYLQTSPEYAMKRLLANGSGDIFQLAKAFRDDEVGRIHNPEFTLLEWYRVGFSMQQLIDEVERLLCLTLRLDGVEQFTYAELFLHHLQFDPLNIDVTSLVSVCDKRGLRDYINSLKNNLQKSANTHNDVLLKDSLLQVLFSTFIEPHVGQDCPLVLTHFPASQAALATLTSNGQTANRFEVYYKGIELANGFDELRDVYSQRKRFEQDNQKRRALGLHEKPIDTHFIAALESGLPQCAGVALGVDRLLMLALDKAGISEVMSFTHQNC